MTLLADPITDLSSLATAVEAVSDLNAFVRSRDCGNYLGLKHHIYRLKNRALAILNEQGATVNRVISVEANCRGCSGTGMWGRNNDRVCRYCDDGKTTLYFRESRIGATFACPDWPGREYVWHTPLSKREAELSRGGAPEPSIDWKPNREGKSMTPQAVAECLNVAEEQFGIANTYRLYLGNLNEQCGLCPTPRSSIPEGQAYHVEPHRGRLAWDQTMCAQCVEHSRKHTTNGSASALLQLPRHLITDHIAEWVERHGHLRKVLTDQIHDPHDPHDQWESEWR